MSHKTDLRQVTQVRSVISCHTHSHAHSSVHPGHRGCRWSLSVAARAKNNNQHRKLKVTRVFLLSIRTKGRSSEKDMQEQGGNRFRSRTSTNPQGIPSCPVRNMVLCLTMCFCHFWSALMIHLLLPVNFPLQQTSRHASSLVPVLNQKYPLA